MEGVAGGGTPVEPHPGRPPPATPPPPPPPLSRTRRHQARLDAKRVVQDLGQRGQAVGGARSVGDDVHGGVVLLFIHPDDKVRRVAGRGRRDDHFGRAAGGGQVGRGRLGRGKGAGRFNHDLGAGVKGPWARGCGCSAPWPRPHMHARRRRPTSTGSEEGGRVVGEKNIKRQRARPFPLALSLLPPPDLSRKRRPQTRH